MYTTRLTSMLVSRLILNLKSAGTAHADTNYSSVPRIHKYKWENTVLGDLGRELGGEDNVNTGGIEMMVFRNNG